MVTAINGRVFLCRSRSPQLTSYLDITGRPESVSRSSAFSDDSFNLEAVVHFVGGAKEWEEGVVLDYPRTQHGSGNPNRDGDRLVGPPTTVGDNDPAGDLKGSVSPESRVPVQCVLPRLILSRSRLSPIIG